MSALSLILASASPRRLDLLGQIGAKPLHVLPADIDESEKPGELPKDYALRMACEKAEAVAARPDCPPGSWILAADTVVAVGRRILPKADSPEQAKVCLDLLSGRAHRIYGGIALISPEQRCTTRVVETRVQFKRLDQAEMSAYLSSSEWEGKAGGYAIQGRAAVFVRAIQGSYSNVVGLSLSDVYAMMTGQGLRVADNWASPA